MLPVAYRPIVFNTKLKNQSSTPAQRTLSFQGKTSQDETSISTHPSQISPIKTKEASPSLFLHQHLYFGGSNPPTPPSFQWINQHLGLFFQQVKELPPEAIETYAEGLAEGLSPEQCLSVSSQLLASALPQHRLIGAKALGYSLEKTAPEIPPSHAALTLEKLITQIIQDPDWILRIQGAPMLKKLAPSPQKDAWIQSLIQDPICFVQISGAERLGELQNPDILLQSIKTLSTNSDSDIQTLAAQATQFILDPERRKSQIKTFAQSSSVALQIGACQAASALPEIVLNDETILSLMQNNNEQVRESAIPLLGKIQSPPIQEKACQMAAYDPQWSNRYSFVDFLGTASLPQKISWLRTMAQDPMQHVSQRAANYLGMSCNH